jgi:hypothetical protein
MQLSRYHIQTKPRIQQQLALPQTLSRCCCCCCHGWHALPNLPASWDTQGGGRHACQMKHTRTHAAPVLCYRSLSCYSCPSCQEEGGRGSWWWAGCTTLTTCAPCTAGLRCRRHSDASTVAAVAVLGAAATTVHLPWAPAVLLLLLLAASTGPPTKASRAPPLLLPLAPCPCCSCCCYACFRSRPPRTTGRRRCRSPGPPALPCSPGSAARRRCHRTLCRDGEVVGEVEGEIGIRYHGLRLLSKVLEACEHVHSVWVDGGGKGAGIA